MTDNQDLRTGHRADLHAAAAGVADMIEEITDFSSPGLGEWDLRGLTGHFVRALRTPIRYLSDPEPRGTPLPGAAHYIAAYLDRRDSDRSGTDSAVAARGAVELANDDRHPADVIRQEAAALDAALAGTRGDRLIRTPFGSLEIDDYLRTRAMEVTVHGTDIARAIGSSWTPPTSLLLDAIGLLAEVAVLRGSAVDLMCALTGRTPPEPGEVLPILR